SATEGLPAAALGKILASRLPDNCLVVSKGAEKTSLLAQAGPPTCTYKNIEDDEVRVPPALRALRTANRTHHCRSPAHHGRRLLNCAAENASSLHRWWAAAEAKVNTMPQPACHVSVNLSLYSRRNNGGDEERRRRKTTTTTRHNHHQRRRRSGGIRNK